MDEANIISTRLGKSEKIMLYILFFVYHMMNTQYKLPYNALLRWGMLFVLLFYYIYKYGGILPRRVFKDSGFVAFALLIVPHFFTVFNTSHAFMRYISLNLTTLVFSLCCNIRSGNKNELLKVFECLSNSLILGAMANTPMLLINAGYYGNRFRGIMSNANGCAIISVFAIIGTLYKMHISRKKILYYPIIIILIIEIILTQSRMAFAACIIVLLLSPFMLQSGNTTRDIIVRVTLTIVICLVGIYVIKNYDLGVIQRLQEGNNTRDSWEYAYTKIMSKPFIGIGYSMTSYYQNLNPYDETWRFFSSYLELCVDCGIYGVLIIACFFASRIIKAFRNLKDDANIIFLLVFVLTGLLIAISESYLLAVGNSISLCFWMGFIIMESYCSLSKERYN